MATPIVHKITDTPPEFPCWLWTNKDREWFFMPHDSCRAEKSEHVQTITHWCHSQTRPTMTPEASEVQQRLDSFAGKVEHTRTEVFGYPPSIPTVTPEDEIVDAIRRVDREYGGDFSKFASEVSTAAEQAVRTVNERHAKSPLWSAAAQPVAQLPDEVREAKADAVELAREILRLDKSCMGFDDRDDFMVIAIELFFEKRLKHITAPDVQKMAEAIAECVVVPQGNPSDWEWDAARCFDILTRFAAGLTAERDALSREYKRIFELHAEDEQRAEKAEAELASWQKCNAIFDSMPDASDEPAHKIVERLVAERDTLRSELVAERLKTYDARAMEEELTKTREKLAKVQDIAREFSALSVERLAEIQRLHAQLAAATKRAEDAEHHLGDHTRQLVAEVKAHTEARAEVERLTKSLEVERQWVASLTKDNGILLQAADSTKAGALAVSQAGQIEHLRAQLAAAQEALRTAEADSKRMRDAIIALDAAANMLLADIRYAWERKFLLQPSYAKVRTDAQELARAAQKDSAK